jgi:uncharacterized membrane protein
MNTYNYFNISNLLILITQFTQFAYASGVRIGWRVYVKIIHEGRRIFRIGFIRCFEDNTWQKNVRKKGISIPKFHKNVEINAPVEKVYSYIEELRKYPGWITNLIEVKDVKESGVGTHYTWTWNMAGIKCKGEATNIEDIPNKRAVVKSKGVIDATWEFKLETHKNVTTLDLDIDYSIPVLVLGKNAKKLINQNNDRDADRTIMNLKDSLES